jgi:hypothetical protein
MVRVSRTGSFAAVLTVAGALLLTGSSAVAGAPVATKSGALINYLTTGKLKIGKKVVVPFQCAVNCNVVSSLKVKGPGIKATDTESGTLSAGVPSGHFIKPNGPLLKAMKAFPGRFRLISNVDATDPVSGATDEISHSFRLKR